MADLAACGCQVISELQEGWLSIVIDKVFTISSIRAMELAAIQFPASKHMRTLIEDLGGHIFLKIYQGYLNKGKGTL